jgi:hypothetical protein
MLTAMAARHQPDPPVLLHYSEDPTIETFRPHVPATNPDRPPMVWTVDEVHAPLFWFPRDCPRITFWPDDRSWRVHAIEAAWLDRVRTCRLHEYRFDPGPFAPWPEADGYWTAAVAVAPASVEPAGDLLARHQAAGIELRVLDELTALRDEVLASGHRFSMARMANAR